MELRGRRGQNPSCGTTTCSWHWQDAPPLTPGALKLPCALDSLAPHPLYASWRKINTSRMRFFCPKLCDRFRRRNPCCARWLWRQPRVVCSSPCLGPGAADGAALCIPSRLPAQGLLSGNASEGSSPLAELQSISQKNIQTWFKGFVCSCSKALSLVNLLLNIVFHFCFLLPLPLTLWSVPSKGYLSSKICSLHSYCQIYQYKIFNAL